MIDKDIKYENSVPQLVKERKDGKRPGYRGDAAYRRWSAQASSRGQGNVGWKSSFGDGPSRPSVSPGGNRDVVMEVLDPVKMPGLYTKSDIESVPVTLKAPGVFDLVNQPDVYAPTNMRFKNMQTLDSFTRTRPDINLPQFGLLKLLEKPLQAFSDYQASVNRPFFEKVIRAGKIPGLNFSTLSDMSSQQLEDAYRDYMSRRMSGEIDAYGNPIMSKDGGGDNPLENILLAQQLANPTVAEPVTEPQENLQGGVAQLYNQYMRNLGYTL